jgi:hypothetical protein
MNGRAEMDAPRQPKLVFLHVESTLVRLKVELFRRLTTDQLTASLAPGAQGSLTVRPDETVLDGHHRLRVLSERGVDVDGLPREIIERGNER